MNTVKHYDSLVREFTALQKLAATIEQDHQEAVLNKLAKQIKSDHSELVAINKLAETLEEDDAKVIANNTESSENRVILRERAHSTPPIRDLDRRQSTRAQPRTDGDIRKDFDLIGSIKKLSI